MDKYWPPGTERLKFDDYVDICRQEPITSADDLMKAFRKIDLNGDGYITLDELYKIMNAQGESMSRDEVKKMIDDVDDNKDGRLDYREFTNMIMKTTEDSKKFSKKVMEKKERRKKREAEKAHSEEVPKATPRVIKREQTVKGKAPSKLLDPKTLRDWSHSSSKGCYFYEEDEIQTHVFTLSLKRDSAVYLTAQPIKEPECVSLPGSEPVDTLLLVFDNQGRLAHWSDARDTRGLYGLSCELTAGVYTVLPYTTGCRFRQRNADLQGSMKEAKLVKVVGDKVQITTKFRQALEDIFELCDLDSNGTMSRDEFNWFNLRTSGEELGQDEWEVVEERTKLEGGEITKQGFIELNEMEAEDAQGDVEDLWITLTSMGMNKALIMDEVCPYKVECYVETGSSFFKVTGIESLHKPEYVTEICKYTIDKAGEPEKIKNMKDLYMYTFKNEHRATIIIDNKSRSLVQMEVDCSRSKNVESNRPSLSCALDIDPQDTVIAHHLIPRSELNDWTVSCTEKILK